MCSECVRTRELADKGNPLFAPVSARRVHGPVSGEVLRRSQRGLGPDRPDPSGSEALEALGALISNKPSQPSCCW